MKERNKNSDTIAAIIIAVLIIGLGSAAYMVYSFWITILDLLNVVIKAY